MWLGSSPGTTGLRARTPPILVVEDDEDTRSFLEIALSEWGHTVICTADGSEAMRVAEHIRPAAIILDLWLPRVNGFAFRSWLLERPRLMDVPVIVLTAAGPVATDPVPDVAILYKPVNFDLLKAMLEAELSSETTVPPRGARTGPVPRR
jgi:DNA-binding response OmpR family regulator